jgi:hypothetical protein
VSETQSPLSPLSTGKGDVVVGGEGTFWVWSVAVGE